MGKHDYKPLIREKSEDETVRVVRADVPSDEFYRARINTLEKENASLRNKLASRADQYQTGNDMSERYIDKLETRIKDLLEENGKLRDALIKVVIGG